MSPLCQSWALRFAGLVFRGRCTSISNKRGSRGLPDNFQVNDRFANLDVTQSYRGVSALSFSSVKVGLTVHSPCGSPSAVNQHFINFLTLQDPKIYRPEGLVITFDIVLSQLSQVLRCKNSNFKTYHHDSYISIFDLQFFKR